MAAATKDPGERHPVGDGQESIVHGLSEGGGALRLHRRMHVGQTYIRAGIPGQRPLDDGVGSVSLADGVDPMTEDPLHSERLDGVRARGHPDQYAPLRVNSAPTVLSRM